MVESLVAGEAGIVLTALPLAAAVLGFSVHEWQEREVRRA
jgi:hypothetical protein